MARNTAGSDLIKTLLLDTDPRPVYLQIWGGTNTVARALKAIEEQYAGSPQWADIQRKVSEKAILYTVLDQDATYRKYVSVKWPGIRVLYNADQFWCLAYPWPRVVPPPLQTRLRGPWMQQNILENHGPLLAAYYTWGDGRRLPGDPEHTHGDAQEARKYAFGKGDFISEGDSPAYFNLIDVGLRNAEDVSYGGWGGRLVRSANNPRRWEDGRHVTCLLYTSPSPRD